MTRDAISMPRCAGARLALGGSGLFERWLTRPQPAAKKLEMQRWSGGNGSGWVVGLVSLVLFVHCGSSERTSEPAKPGAGGEAGQPAEQPEAGHAAVPSRAGSPAGGASSSGGVGGGPIATGGHGGSEAGQGPTPAAGQGGVAESGGGGEGGTAIVEAGAGGESACTLPQGAPGSGEQLAFQVASDYATFASYVGLPFELVDLDGDTYLDAVMALTSGGKLAILRGTQAGTFLPVTELVFPYVVGAVAHDVNGDGIVDLFMHQSGLALGQNQALLALGKGDGSFGDPKALYALSGHGLPRFHDLVGDDSLDLVVPRGGFNEVNVYQGDGLGGFTLALTLPLTAPPQTLELADLDGDLAPDLVVTAQVGQTQSLLIAWGKAQGGFEPFASQSLSTLFGQTAEATRELHVADVDDDGDDDLLFVAPQSANLVLGSLTRTLAFSARFDADAKASGGALADLDADGKVDLVLTNMDDSLFTIRYGLGNGSFGPALEYTAGNNVSKLEVGDVDADGDLDLAFSAGQVTLVLSDGARRWRAAPVLRRGVVPGVVRLADLDRDQRLDLLSIDDTRLLVSRGDGKGGFEAEVAYPLGTKLLDAVAFHGNADAYLDVALLTQDNRFGFLAGSSSGTLAVPASLAASGYLLATGDVNEDGHVDVVTATYKFVYVHEADGNGGFTRKTAHDQGVSFASLSLQDVDGDQHLDALLAGYDTSDVTILRGAGDGTFTPSNGKLDLTYGGTQILAEDFTGDCRTDLLVNQFSSVDSLLLFTAQDAGVFDAPKILPSNYGVEMASADLDRDGWLDAVLVHFGVSACQLELNQGGGTFSRRLFGCSRVNHLAIGDLNRDGRQDIVLSHDTPGYISVALNRSQP